MKIRKIENVEIIIPLHKQIFGKEFPIGSYNKKKLNNDIDIYIYEKGEEIVGYSIIIIEKEQKNMYAWYGGVLPKYQGNGLTKKFIEELIRISREKGYFSITLASTNLRPHMLILAINMGFDIDRIKNRDYGEGNKIYFKYLIKPKCEENLYLYENGKNLLPSEAEERLIKAYKNNAVSINIITYDNVETLLYVIKYCNSFYKKPKLNVTWNSEKSLDSCTMEEIKRYKGEINISN